MLLLLLTGLLGLATVLSAAITPPLHTVEAQLPPSPQNSSTGGWGISTNLNSSLTSFIDPRLTYDRRWAEQSLDKKSAYMNTLLALADLSTKGWISTLRWGAGYSLSSYKEVTITIHASHDPSSLQYRQAIWGLYLAIRESSANGFRACLLKLYWSRQIGLMPQDVGYVSILRGSSLGIDSNNSTNESLELATPKQAITPEIVSANHSNSLNKSAALTTRAPGTDNLKVEISLLERSLDIDAIFHMMYAAVVYLAAFPQFKRIDKPGYIKDSVSHTILRWDSSYLTVQPDFEYRFLIAALPRLPAYMYEQDRFREARFIVYVDDIEVGRGWLYGSEWEGVPRGEWLGKV